MGSENNMVAVPVECTDEIAEAIAMEANVCGGIAETIWRKAIAAARLVSPQPDAQQGENIPAGMRQWNGGDTAPKDWDGGPVLFREAGLSNQAAIVEDGPLSWQHIPHASPFDIIAYTPTHHASEQSAPPICSHEEMGSYVGGGRRCVSCGKKIATPPSPALDAATIERIIAELDAEQDRLWKEDYLMDTGDCIMVMIELAAKEGVALPNAEKRHG